jgi:hypothetical protein
MGDLTWVVVRNWPQTSSPEERKNDIRFKLDPSAGWLIRRSDGRLLPPDAQPRIYFFDGETNTSFPVQMKEDDLIDFRPESFRSYGDVLHYFQRFKVPTQGTGAAEGS